jgi:hypothetical protein
LLKGDFSLDYFKTPLFDDFFSSVGAAFLGRPRAEYVAPPELCFSLPPVTINMPLLWSC